MKKIVLATMVVLATIIFLTSCSQKKQELPNPDYSTKKKASQKDTNADQADEDLRNLRDSAPKGDTELNGNKSITITGKVGLVDYPQQARLGDLPIQYVIDVVLTNNSRTTIKYNSAIATFSAANNKHSSLEIKRKLTELRPGKPRQLVFYTGNITGEILGNSSEGSIQFSIALMANQRIVAGPFRAKFPDITDLLEPSGKRKLKSLEF